MKQRRHGPEHHKGGSGMIQNYTDFLAALNRAGFSMGGGNNEGIYSVMNWNWNQQPPYPTPVAWHTGDREMDPWEWRMRVLDEGLGIGYGKFFFKKSGYITKKWFHLFLKPLHKRVVSEGLDLLSS